MRQKVSFLVSPPFEEACWPPESLVSLHSVSLLQEQQAFPNRRCHQSQKVFSVSLVQRRERCSFPSSLRQRLFFSGIPSSSEARRQTRDNSSCCRHELLRIGTWIQLHRPSCRKRYQRGSAETLLL